MTFNSLINYKLTRAKKAQLGLDLEMQALIQAVINLDKSHDLTGSQFAHF